MGTDVSVEEARERARQWRQRWKYEPGSMLEIHLAEPEALIDALADENERLVREYVEPMASGVVPRQRAIDAVNRAERAVAEAATLRQALEQIADPSYIGNYVAEEVVTIYRKWARAALGSAAGSGTC